GETRHPETGRLRLRERGASTHTRARFRLGAAVGADRPGARRAAAATAALAPAAVALPVDPDATRRPPAGPWPTHDPINAPSPALPTPARRLPPLAGRRDSGAPPGAVNFPQDRADRDPSPGAARMALNPSSFLYEHDAGTGGATITLNRPEKLNALTFEVYEELRDTFRALDTEPGVRAIVITGTGRAFCSGGDVEDI